MARLGYDDDDHLDQMEELLGNLRSDLEAVGDAATCQKKYEHLLHARGSLGELAGHAESLMGMGGGDQDERVAEEYTQLDEWYRKVKESFGSECVRGGAQ
jgi:hypothetical protein